MDLKEYEDQKFLLAHIVRGIAEVVPRGNELAREGIAELFARLAEDRFNVVVVGHFNRGKTSLMNALLRTERLPTGVVPLTSVITTVSYGSREEVAIRFRQGGLPMTIGIDELPDYLTQAGNPGNARNVRTADVRLPAALLRRGFYLVDTPGLGSAIRENTFTTQDYLGEADAFFLVTAYDSPLSSDEVSVLREAVASQQRVFVIVNKHDTVAANDRETTLAYIREQLDQLADVSSISLHSVSATEAITAHRLQDEQLHEHSGLPALEEQIVRFLVEKKSAEILMRTSSRIAELLEALPESMVIREFRTRLLDVQSGLTGGVSASATTTPIADEAATDYTCEICEATTTAVFAHLRVYQYDLTIDERTQLAHARRGGFCPFHAWQYASLASPQGIAKAYPALLRAVAGTMRERCDAPAGAGDASIAHCPSCLIAARSERQAIVSILRRLRAQPWESAAIGPLCVPHLRQLLTSSGTAVAASALLQREAAILERLAEDMQRFALKHDALRRALANDEERRSGERALLVLSGKRNLSGPAGRTDYL